MYTKENYTEHIKYNKMKIFILNYNFVFVIETIIVVTFFLNFNTSDTLTQST